MKPKICQIKGIIEAKQAKNPNPDLMNATVGKMKTQTNLAQAVLLYAMGGVIVLPPPISRLAHSEIW